MARPLPPVKTVFSFEDYLAFEHSGEQKHEFVHGQIFAMAGATERHNRIALALASRLLTTSDLTRCRVLMSDVKVRTPNIAFAFFLTILHSPILTPDQRSAELASF